MSATEAIDVKEVGEGNVAALPVQVTALIEQAAPTGEIERSFNAYAELYDRLLVRPGQKDSDFQVIRGKAFPTKSAFRKLATAFAVSTRILTKEYEWEGPDTGRRRKLRMAVVTAVAEAPNGRTAEGIAACDVYEKCIDTGCGPGCEKDHKHIQVCAEDCPGTVHFSHPTHDIIATAATRATNRACSDLFGMGQVSAEEVDRETGEVQGRQQQAAPEPVPPGFSSQEMAVQAHNLAGARVKKLAERLREPFRHYRQQYGWPMPKDKLDQFTAMLDDAEKQEAAHAESGGYRAAPDQAALDERARAQQQRIDEAGAQAAQEHVQQGGTSQPTGTDEAMADTEKEAVAALRSQVSQEMTELEMPDDQRIALLEFQFGQAGAISFEELDAPACIDLIDTLSDIRAGTITYGDDGWVEQPEDGGDDAQEPAEPPF